MTTTDLTDTVSRVRLVEPLPGFDGHELYSLRAIDPQGLLFSLLSEHDPALRFVLAAPENFFDDYDPVVPPAALGVLGADSTEQLRLLVVLTIVAGLDDATANLRAPLALDRATGAAMQVILEDETLPMRRPLVDRVTGSPRRA